MILSKLRVSKQNRPAAQSILIQPNEIPISDPMMICMVLSYKREPISGGSYPLHVAPGPL